MSQKPASPLASSLASRAAERLERLGSLLATMPAEDLGRVAERLHRARLEGRAVWLMGNGGSAASSLHITCDLAMAGAASADLPALRVHSLAANPALLTALANDHGYDQVFVRQLEAVLQPGDVLVGISASGRSPSCLLAMERARAMGATTVGLLGFDGGAMVPLCDLHLLVPVHDFGLVEDLHLVIGHTLATCLIQAAG